MKLFLLPLVLSALTLAAPGTSAAADGKALYSTTCVSCHGANGKGAFPGVPDLGPRMTKTDAQLSNSILNGFQTKGSPMAMPAKGGNPALTAADADALVVYLRTQLLGNAAPAQKPSASKPAATAAAAVPKPAAAKSLAAKSPATAVAEQAPLASEPPATTQEPTAVPPPTTTEASAPAAGPPSDMAAFARGAKAWGEHCASCHSMRDPKDFSDAQWKLITTHMRLRAGLDGADVRDINTFLTGSN
jgi:mono/diheme cytochrome c family protein